MRRSQARSSQFRRPGPARRPPAVGGLRAGNRNELPARAALARCGHGVAVKPSVTRVCAPSAERPRRLPAWRSCVSERVRLDTGSGQGLQAGTTLRRPTRLKLCGSIRSAVPAQWLLTTSALACGVGGRRNAPDAAAGNNGEEHRPLAVSPITAQAAPLTHERNTEPPLAATRRDQRRC
jgi:hypothetical protein